MESGDVASGKNLVSAGDGFGGKSTMNNRSPPRDFDPGYKMADNTLGAGSLSGGIGGSSLLGGML